jgi:sugar transferase EpsL
MVKRIFDLIAGILFITILSPVMIILGLLILINSGCPVIFKQLRPGQYGRPFYLFKFRTMFELKDDCNKHLSDELRLTGLGRVLRKYSLDELPQLFNVIRGELSFVGPRPLLMQYLELYTTEQARRHEVKPGITGWAQVNGRNAISWEEKFELDVWYVDNQTLWLDLRILWLTVIKVLRAEGISGEGSATMSEFMGDK